MTGYTRRDSTIGADVVEILSIFTVAMLLCWATLSITDSTEGGELLQENNTEGVGSLLSPSERSEEGRKREPHH